MKHLERAKLLLELAILIMFLLLLAHLLRTKGSDHALGLLTNKP